MREPNCSTEHTSPQENYGAKNEEIQNANQEACSQRDLDQQIRDDLNDRLAEISVGAVKEKWNAFKLTVYKISKGKLGNAVRKHDDWFDGNSMKLEELINNRKPAKNNMLSRNTKSDKARYRTYSHLLRLRCREVKNKLWRTKAAELHTLASSNGLKVFCQSMRVM